MNQEKIQNQVTKNWNNKSQYDWELMYNLNTDNPVITWDEYYEINKMHVEFEEGCEKLGFKLPFQS
tara:strand:+ start:713 stop:910 length:198 start_codon:yes stop_codon:yes gene_type:complete